jgi:hypothetical protein
VELWHGGLTLLYLARPLSNCCNKICIEIVPRTADEADCVSIPSCFKIPSLSRSWDEAAPFNSRNEHGGIKYGEEKESLTTFAVMDRFSIAVLRGRIPSCSGGQASTP